MSDPGGSADAESVYLCSLADIPDGGALGFNPPPGGTRPLFAVRRGRSVFVYRDECPHQGAPLAWRRNAYLSPDARQIVCFAHGARFELETGLCTAGPCVGERLQSVPAHADGTGAIRLIPQTSR